MKTTTDVTRSPLAKEQLTLLHPSTTIFSNTRGFICLCLDAPPPARALAVAPSKSTPLEFEEEAVPPSATAAAAPPLLLPASPLLLLVDLAFSPVTRYLAALESLLVEGGVVSAAAAAAASSMGSGTFVESVLVDEETLLFRLSFLLSAGEVGKPPGVGDLLTLFWARWCLRAAAASAGSKIICHRTGST